MSCQVNSLACSHMLAQAPLPYRPLNALFMFLGVLYCHVSSSPTSTSRTVRHTTLPLQRARLQVVVLVTVIEPMPGRLVVVGQVGVTHRVTRREPHSAVEFRTLPIVRIHCSDDNRPFHCTYDCALGHVLLCEPAQPCARYLREFLFHFWHRTQRRTPSWKYDI